jgi:hypothetical protein
MDCLWTTFPLVDLNMLVHLSILKKFFLCHWQMLNITLMDFDDASSDSFFAPRWFEYCFFSFSGSTGLPSEGQLFKGYQAMLISFLSRILQIRPMFWNQISYFKDHVYSCLIIEIKSKRCQILKVFLEIQASLVKDPTHVIQNMQSFDCLVF